MKTPQQDILNSQLNLENTNKGTYSSRNHKYYAEYLEAGGSMTFEEYNKSGIYEEGAIMDPSKKLIEREQLQGTPFWIIKNDEEFNLIMGRYKLNEFPLRTREEVDRFMTSDIWNLILKIILAVIQDTLTELEKKNNQPSTNGLDNN